VAPEDTTVTDSSLTEELAQPDVLKGISSDWVWFGGKIFR
jgi:hypothetical protein